MAAVYLVCHGPTDHGDQEDGSAHGEGIQAEQERRRAQAQQQPWLRHSLRPGSDVGQQTGEPKRAKTSREQKSYRLTKGTDKASARSGQAPLVHIQFPDS
jgi:hypothetical protein